MKPLKQLLKKTLHSRFHCRQIPKRMSRLPRELQDRVLRDTPRREKPMCWVMGCTEEEGEVAGERRCVRQCRSIQSEERPKQYNNQKLKSHSVHRNHLKYFFITNKNQFAFLLTMPKLVIVMPAFNIDTR